MSKNLYTKFVVSVEAVSPSGIPTKFSQKVTPDQQPVDALNIILAEIETHQRNIQIAAKYKSESPDLRIDEPIERGSGSKYVNSNYDDKHHYNKELHVIRDVKNTAIDNIVYHHGQKHQTYSALYVVKNITGFDLSNDDLTDFVIVSDCHQSALIYALEKRFGGSWSKTSYWQFHNKEYNRSIKFIPVVMSGRSVIIEKYRISEEDNENLHNFTICSLTTDDKLNNNWIPCHLIAQKLRLYHEFGGQPAASNVPKSDTDSYNIHIYNRVFTVHHV